jgi:hypothetical protein
MQVKSLLSIAGLAFVCACSQSSLTSADNSQEVETSISDLKHKPSVHGAHASNGHGGHASNGHDHGTTQPGGGHHEEEAEPEELEDDAEMEEDEHAEHGGHGQNNGTVPKVFSQPWPTKNKRAMAIREKRVKKIYENLIYPTPISILKGETTMTDVFEEKVVRGRVNPVGDFPEFASVLEYFYALAVTPGSVVQAVKFKSLFAGDDKVAVEVDIFFCRAPYEGCDPNVPVSANAHTLTQVGFFQFNRFNRVISLDLNILNLGRASDLPDIPEVHAEAIAQICTALTIAHISPLTGAVVYSGTCTSSFDSADDFAPEFPVSDIPFQNCVGFMQSIPFGTWDRGHSNTVVCRQLHSLLTPVDPDMHCPHTSPSGGGKCEDVSYADYYAEDF